MDWLNYHHLLYFWVVAKRGSIARASEELHLAHPTVSGQIHTLEEALGQKLFTRKGRALVLTDAGRLAFRYAEEIFSLGSELLDAIRGRGHGKPLLLVVGVCDALAKSMVHRILEPAFRLPEPVRIVCREDRTVEGFIAELALHTVDVVLADSAAPSASPVRAFSHPLGECGSSFLAAPRLARSCRRGFPASLDGIPFLVPRGSSSLRGALDDWFRSHSIRPNVVAELDDAALANILGEADLGVYLVPDIVESEVRRRYHVHVVGRVPQLRQRYYAISLERKISHPAVAAICELARKHIFT